MYDAAACIDVRQGRCKRSKELTEKRETTTGTSMVSSTAPRMYRRIAIAATPNAVTAINHRLTKMRVAAVRLVTDIVLELLVVLLLSH